MEHLTGEHDDQFPDTLKLLRVVSFPRRTKSSESIETTVFEYTFVDEDTEYVMQVSAVEIECPGCETDQLARLDSDGNYYCTYCDHSEEYDREMLFRHGCRMEHTRLEKGERFPVETRSVS